MTNIGILTFQDGYKRGATDFYPLIKWQKELKRKGIVFQFIKSHKDEKLYKQDVVIIDHRYYRTLTIHKNIYEDKYFILEVITKLKKKFIKVVLFDTGDGAGSEQWDLINLVDLFLKKQILKNTLKYTENKGVESYMPFVTAYELDNERIEQNLAYREQYSPCPENQLHKVKLAWNIGMIDYRRFPFSKYYPIGTSRLLNSIYKIPDFCIDFSIKTLDSVFRGKIKKNENYSFQRNKVIELFNKDKYPNLITGELISRIEYLKELRKSKTCVSPFGWGEVCFRDFEAIINGCVLIKPNMDHLETWPNVYQNGETYVSIKWDMSDLEETLNEVTENYKEYKSIAKNAQRLYKSTLMDNKGFVNRFKKILEI